MARIAVAAVRRMARARARTLLRRATLRRATSSLTVDVDEAGTAAAVEAIITSCVAARATPTLTANALNDKL